MLLLPHVSPRRFFFAITVPPGFRESPGAQASLRRYHLWVAAAAGVGIVAALLLTPAGMAWAPLLPVLVALAAFLRERAAVRRIAPRPAEAATEAAQAPGDGRLPRWTILAAGPFAFPLATALYLRARWDELPARFPIHWDLHGEPNGWATKTFRGVYGPLFFAVGLLLLIVMVGLATYFGSRRAPIRKPVLAMLIGAMYLLGLAFSAVGLMPLVRIPAAVFLIPFFIFLACVLLWSVRAGRTAAGEATPDECWTLGSIYYNPNDPALFVQKRFGIGYTFNFANRRSWLILGLLLGGVAALILLLPK
jgi:uncharacterized membrane protein